MKNNEEKQNVVVSLIDFCNKFKNDIRKTSVKNRIENLMLETELKQNEIETFKMRMEHDKVESKLNYLESIANTKVMTVLLFLLMLASIVLTPMGYGLFYISFLSITLIVVLTIIQILTFYIAAIKTQVYLYFNKSYSVINMITMILVPISIIGNYNTLVKVIILDNPLIAKIVTALICIMLDISIITLNTLKHDKKHKNFTTPIENEMQDKISIFHMLKTIIFDSLRIKLMKPYFEIRNNFKDNLKQFKDNTQDFKDNLETSGDNLKILNNFKDNSNCSNDSNISDLSKFKNFKDKKQLDASNTNDMLGIFNQDKDNTKAFKDNLESFKDNPKIPIDFKDSIKSFKDNTKNFKDNLETFKDNLEIDELTFEDKYAIIKNQVRALNENETISKKTFKHLITKDNDWKKVRKNLINDGLAFTENTTTRRTNNKLNEKVAK